MNPWGKNGKAQIVVQGIGLHNWSHLYVQLFCPELVVVHSGAQVMSAWGKGNVRQKGIGGCEWWRGRGMGVGGNVFSADELPCLDSLMWVQWPTPAEGVKLYQRFVHPSAFTTALCREITWSPHTTSTHWPLLSTPAINTGKIHSQTNSGGWQITKGVIDLLEARWWDMQLRRISQRSYYRVDSPKLLISQNKPAIKILICLQLEDSQMKRQETGLRVYSHASGSVMMDVGTMQEMKMSCKMNECPFWKCMM